MDIERAMNQSTTDGKHIIKWKKKNSKYNIFM